MSQTAPPPPQKKKKSAWLQLAGLVHSFPSRGPFIELIQALLSLHASGLRLRASWFLDAFVEASRCSGRFSGKNKGTWGVFGKWWP